MIFSAPRVPPGQFADLTGWHIPSGICAVDECVLPSPIDQRGLIDVREAAKALGMACIEGAVGGVYALGPRCRPVVNAGCPMPHVVLPDERDQQVDLGALQGQMLLVVFWASWCRCRDDLAGWRDLYAQLAPAGLRLITIALDSKENAAPWMKARAAGEYALYDEAHTVRATLSVTNVPMAMMIAENGQIRRTPETALFRRPLPRRRPESTAPESAASSAARILDERQSRAGGYERAVRAWAAGEAQSSTDGQVMATPPACPTADQSAAAAHFELGQYFACRGAFAAAAVHFRKASELDPGAWTYRRQAYSYPEAGSEAYELPLMEAIAALGVNAFRPPSPLDE